MHITSIPCRRSYASAPSSIPTRRWRANAEQPAARRHGRIPDLRPTATGPEHLEAILAPSIVRRRSELSSCQICGIAGMGKGRVASRAHLHFTVARISHGHKRLRVAHPATLLSHGVVFSCFVANDSELRRDQIVVDQGDRIFRHQLFAEQPRFLAGGLRRKPAQQDQQRLGRAARSVSQCVSTRSTMRRRNLRGGAQSLSA